jgi:hypothetical protein
VGKNIFLDIDSRDHDVNKPAVASCVRGDIEPPRIQQHRLGVGNHRVLRLFDLGTTQRAYPCLDALALLGLSCVTPMNVLKEES